MTSSVGLERSISKSVGSTDLKTHIASGAVTGGLLGGLFGGLGKAPAGIALMSALSAAGYGGSIGFEAWREARRRQILAQRGVVVEDARCEASGASSGGWWPTWLPIQKEVEGGGAGGEGAGGGTTES